MVGKMFFEKRVLTGLLIGGGSGWPVSPHSQQLEARLPWEGSSISRRRMLMVELSEQAAYFLGEEGRSTVARASLANNPTRSLYDKAGRAHRVRPRASSIRLKQARLTFAAGGHPLGLHRVG
jgi:hypothetical protein